MVNKKFFKILIPILFTLAVLLGLLQKSQEKYVYDFQERSAAADGGLEGYYKKAENILGAETQKQTLTFLSVGDIMLSRNVALAIQKSGDANYAFQGMTKILKSTDFNFANLETPIALSGGTVGGHSLVFNSPQAYVTKLKDYNFQILNLANNHAFDQGLKGLKQTITILDENNFTHMGTGNNLGEAWQPAIVETNGIKICFVGASYASINDNGKTTNTYVARVEDIENLKLEIRNAKSLCDFTVATMHAGTEYVRKPNKTQIDFAHAAIDYGADMVIGAHPHWIQTTEKYNGRWIFYSLGNFIFDQDFSQETKEGLTLKIKLSKEPTPTLQGSQTPAKLDSIELIPVIIENAQPRPATQEESKKILQKIGQSQNILYP